MDQTSFLSVAPQLLLPGNRCAVAQVRRRVADRYNEWVVTHFRVAAADGQDLPPLIDWAVAAASTAGRQTLEDLLSQVRPKRSQVLILLLLDSEDRSRFQCGLWRDGQWQSPEELHFVGPGMPILGRGSNGLLLDLPEHGSQPASRSSSLRDSRTQGALKGLHTALKMDSNGRLTHAVVVGAGGGGQQLATQLVASGVRRLSLIDGDKIGLENLDRLPLAGPKDVGRRKVLQLARALSRQQPELLVHALPTPVHASKAITYLQSSRADVLFSFVDSQVGRLATMLLAREMHAVHIDVGTLVEYARDSGQERRVMSADIRLFAPGLGCVACVPRMPAEALDDELYHLSAPPGCLKRGRGPQAWNATRDGSLLHLNQVAAALAVEAWFNWLEARVLTSTWTRLRWEGLSPQVESLPVGPATDCRFCN